MQRQHELTVYPLHRLKDMIAKKKAQIMKTELESEVRVHGGIF